MTIAIKGGESIKRLATRFDRFAKKTLPKRMDAAVMTITKAVIVPAISAKIRSGIGPGIRPLTVFMRDAFGFGGNDSLVASGKLSRSYKAKRLGRMRAEAAIPAGMTGSRQGLSSSVPMRKVAGWVQSNRVIVVTKKMHNLFAWASEMNPMIIPPKVGNVLFAPARPFIVPVANDPKVLKQVAGHSVNAILKALRDVGIK